MELKVFVPDNKRPGNLVSLFFFFELFVLILKDLAFVDLVFLNRRRISIEDSPPSPGTRPRPPSA